MQPSLIFLIYVQPRQKKLIISHKLTIGENFKLLNDIKITPQPLCCLAIVLPCGTHPVIKG
jgi:hypothetical protein